MRFYATLRSFMLKHAKPLAWILSAVEMLAIIYIAIKFTFLKGLCVMVVFLTCMVAFGAMLGICDAAYCNTIKRQFKQGYRSAS